MLMFVFGSSSPKTKVNTVLFSSLCISWQMTGTTFASNHLSILIMTNRYNEESIAQQRAFYDMGIFANLKEDLKSGESYIFIVLIMIFLEDTYLAHLLTSLRINKLCC